MHAPLIGHFLIGPPGCGKSTLASLLAKLGNYRIVSTDQIRKELYGDESIQGIWAAIEEKVISEIQEAIAVGIPVIYDATNAKRSRRMDFLMKLNSGKSPASPGYAVWMAWYLTTPLEVCKAWNRKRDRQVPEGVIESMFKSLQDFPPVPAEGFASVARVASTVDGFDLEAIHDKIKSLNRAIANRKVSLHAYSRLLDFDRLLHLIALTIGYPGIGCLHLNDPILVEQIFGTVPYFASPIDEVCAFMRQLNGDIYAEPDAIATDLQWLEQNGLIGCSEVDAEIVVATLDDPNLVVHAYSDVEPFKRLLKTIRFILHHPFLPNSGESSLETLVTALKERGIITGDCLDTVREDIEKVLKPYKILAYFPQGHGYD